MAAPPDPFTVTLRDGTRALIRPIRPEDKERLAEGLRRLSPEARYARFHSVVDRLTPEQLRYLTEIDYADHMAWAAVNIDAPDEPGMGVARYVRLPQEPEIAEAAVTVADDYQGKGLGSLLLLTLCRSAIEHGIRTLRNYVLVDNDAMLGLLDELGATRHDEGEGVYRVDMPLPDHPDELPDTAAMRVLRATATDRLPPFRKLVHWLTPRAERAPERPRRDLADEDLVADIERQLWKHR